MNRTIRIILYVLSVLTAAALFFALVAVEKKKTELKSEYHKRTEQTQDTAASVSVTEDRLTDTGAAGGTEQSGINMQATEEGTDFGEVQKSTEPDAEQAQQEETTIIFTGDVLFEKAFWAGYDANGIDGVISPELREQLNAADILMINHEFAFSDRGTPMPDKQFTFRCSPSYVTALQEMGVDIVTLANNHSLDFGPEALTDTFTTLDGAGIPYVGAGDSVERAEQLQVIEVNGKKFGFLGVTRVVPDVSWKIENAVPGLFSCYDDTRLVELVKEARNQCDFLVVYPHWGLERQEYPEEYQTSIATRCFRAGADLIVGAHSHCLQGIEYIEGKPVFYSLGNFIFGYNIERSAYLKVTVDADGNAAYQMVPVFASGGVTQLADDTAAADTFAVLNRISETAQIAADGTVTQ